MRINHFLAIIILSYSCNLFASTNDCNDQLLESNISNSELKPKSPSLWSDKAFESALRSEKVQIQKDRSEDLSRGHDIIIKRHPEFAYEREFDLDKFMQDLNYINKYDRDKITAFTKNTAEILQRLGPNVSLNNTLSANMEDQLKLFESSNFPLHRLNDIEFRGTTYSRSYAIFEKKLIINAIHEALFNIETTPEQRIRFAIALLVNGAGLYDELALDIIEWQLLRMDSENQRLHVIRLILDKLIEAKNLKIFMNEARSKYSSFLNDTEFLKKTKNKIGKEKYNEIVRQIGEGKVIDYLFTIYENTRSSYFNFDFWPQEIKNAWLTIHLNNWQFDVIDNMFLKRKFLEYIPSKAKNKDLEVAIIGIVGIKNQAISFIMTYVLERHYIPTLIKDIENNTLDEKIFLQVVSMVFAESKLKSYKNTFFDQTLWPALEKHSELLDSPAINKACASSSEFSEWLDQKLKTI